MKAILINKDKSLCWTEVPEPKIKDDEVLIAVQYAALNRADLMQREGNYPPPEGCPDWMGLEVSGTIVQMGDVAEQECSFGIGDSVCALLGGGGYAEYVAIRYDMLLPIPNNCTMAEAAAMPEAFATAYLNLFIEGNIKRGDTLLMHAGASGLASVVIPMAKAFGIRVITTVLSDEIADSIKHLNADIVVNTSKEDIVRVLKHQLELNKPVDVALDCLGGSFQGDCLPYMQHGGRWIMIATLAGDITQIDLRNIYVRNIRIIGSTLRSRSPKMKAEIISRLTVEIWPKVEQGLIKPTIYKILPIEQAEEAHSLLENGINVGKVVLKVAGDTAFF